MSKIFYRSGYKYQLVEDYAIKLPIFPGGSLDIIADFYTIAIDGLLTVKAGYAWDGASGPAIDTPAFMRGSLVHDVLYQAMKEGHLPTSMREAADRILRDLCREDGMSALRAWWVYRAVRFAGGNYVSTPEKPPAKAP